MYERIERVKKRVVVDRYPICIEKYRIYADVVEKNKHDAPVVQRGKVLKAWTERMPIEIAADELIVGIGASKPLGLEIDPNYGIWTQDEIDSLVEDGYIISEQDQRDLQELNKRHNPPTMIGLEGDFFYNHPNQQVIKLLKEGLVLPPWKAQEGGGVGGGYAQSGLGLGPSLVLLCVEYDKILKNGTLALIEQCRDIMKDISFETADDMQRFRSYRGYIYAFEAINILALRYSKLAAEMAEKENDPARKKELEQISYICSRVPMYPAEGFREAMQCFWFQFLMLSPSTTLPGGRFDQIMYPYYKADIEAGRITKEEATELLCLLRLKDMELNRTSGKNNRKKNAGFAKWHNFLIGGVKSDGSDATNELSYMILDAALITRVPHHTITLCVAESTPMDLIMKGVECQVAGLSMPAFISDDSYINFFTMHGVDIEDARGYAITGCLDANLPGESRTGPVPMTIMPLIFDLMRHNGRGTRYPDELIGIETGDFTKFASYDELWDAWEKQFKYCIDRVCEKNNAEILATQEVLSDPLRSALMQNGIETGKDIWIRNDIPFDNTASVCTIGMVNVGDSLAAIKKLVFDEKKYTMKELYDALEADWEGYEDMQKDFLNAPKYGNDDPYVDEIVARCYKLFSDYVVSHKTITGGIMVPCGISITSHQPGGLLTGATPDGRKAGTLLADGTMSPMQGRDHNGPVAVMNSALRIDQDPFQATLLNMKFDPNNLKSSEDKKKFAMLIRTYLRNGGKHVQFNIVTQETLEDARDNPKDHRDLLIRIAGYSAYFVQLNQEMQTEVINRNVQRM